MSSLSQVARDEPWGDGRTARRDRNKEAVLDAVIELFTEDNLDPGPDQVAERVGLSARSVYRYFEDREGLVRAAIERHLERVFPHYLIHAIGEGPLESRVERFVAARLHLYQTIAATARASRLRAVNDPIVAEQVAATRRALGHQVARHFAPELRPLPAAERRSVSAAVDALCQLETLDHFMVHLGLSRPQTHRLLVDALGHLVPAQGRGRQ
jgi:AcrR family transcriptional regulator